MVLFSFNAGRHASEISGLSLQWYGKALGNPFLVEALQNSLIIATTSALLAAVFGTAAALGLARVGARTRAVFDALLGAAIVVPGVVIGIATLVALVAAVRRRQPVPRLAVAGRRAAAADARLWLDHRRARPFFDGAGGDDRAHPAGQPRPQPGRGVERSLRDAAHHFRSVVFPQILPAVLAGFLLAFTFSFDDFIVAFFVAGAQTTLPIYVFASIRRGVTPEINAIATVVLVASVLMVLLAQMLLRQRKPPQ